MVQLHLYPSYPSGRAVAAMDSDEASSIATCHVVAIPYPGRGHVNAMINVFRRLSAEAAGGGGDGGRGLSCGLLLVTLVVTEEWEALLMGSDDDGDPPLPSNSNFRFQLRTIPNVVPSETSRGSNFLSFFQAVFTNMESPVAHLLDRLLLLHHHKPPPPVVIMADTFLPWAVALGNRRSIPVVSFWPMSSTTLSILAHVHLLRINGHHPFDVAEKGNTSVCYFPGLSSIRLRDLPSGLQAGNSPLLQRIEEALAWVPKAQCLLLASVRELEAAATDAIRALLQLPVYTVGPSISYMTLGDRGTQTNGCSRKDYCEWLDSKTKQSVLYVSFGSYFGVSGTQLDEIAAGLRASGVHFLWAAAHADGRHLQEVCGDKGLVVPWCDQLRVLCHPSTRAFFTHCGWNSTMEGIFAGMIMLTFPLGAEQYTNAKLIVDDWKFGVRVKPEMGRDEVVKREEIAGIVRRVMDLEGNEGKEMKRRAKELQEACKTAIRVGGSSNTSINAFAKDFLHGHFSL